MINPIMLATGLTMAALSKLLLSDQSAKTFSGKACGRLPLI